MPPMEDTYEIPLLNYANVISFPAPSNDVQGLLKMYDEFQSISNIKVSTI